MRIVFLEDDQAQADTIKGWLTDAGHDVKHYTHAKSFLTDCGKESFDLFIFDWILPDLSGEETLMIIRKERGLDTPVIFATSRDSEEDIVSALKKGADDYMIKPIRRMELLSRIDALYRRSRSLVTEEKVLNYPPYQIDTIKRVITIDDEPIELTGKEFDLSVFLFKNIGRLISRGHILETIWNKNPNVMTRTLDTHMSRIRTRLNLRPENGYRLTPIYNYGYRLERID